MSDIVTPELWAEYVAFTETTAIYPKGHEALYLNAGLLSEIGELAGQAKKAIRDDGNVITPERRKLILHELGDIAWYMARLTSACRWKAYIDRNPYTEETIPADKFSEVIIGISRDMSRSDAMILGGLHTVAVMLGSSLPEVLRMNMAKLKSRQERGKLGGSGDDR